MVQFGGQKRRRRNPRGWLTVREAAERMGLHTNSILWNIRQGYLRARYDGYRYYIHPQDLQRFEEEFYK
jgi:excisionase family DNA binding protein